MPIERIKITGDEFRATSINSEITFSSKNLYLKTLSTGSIKVGGYDRAPFLMGYDVQTDRLAAGGFGVFPTEYSDSLEFIVPFNNDNNWQVTATRPSPYNEPYYSADPVNLSEYYWQSYSLQYSRYSYRDGTTTYGTFRWYMAPARFSGDVLPILISGGDFSLAGLYRFPRVGYEGPWTQRPDAPAVGDVTLGPTANIRLAKMGIFFTQPSVNLALAVTP